MHVAKKIIRRECPATLKTNLGHLSPLLQRVYAAREVQSDAELNRDLNSLLPFALLKDIDKAVLLLKEAIYRNKKILIVGDFDADGATSTALAVRALKSFGAKQVSYRVPNRFADGYGLTEELINQLVDFIPDLIVTVDNGIANHTGVQAAKQKGMQVVITDHHLPAKTLPVADVIVNPNQPEDLFPSKNLAGVGVIFYVMLALRRQLANDNWFSKHHLPEPNMAQFLDLVALGTVADLVPLDANNRTLIYHGLKRIRFGKCVPGIVALLEYANRNFMSTCAADLGFAVAARLNAAGRLDDMSQGIACLLSDNASEARKLAGILDRLNDERKNIEQDMQTQALNALDKLNVEAKGILPYGLCLFDESWHQGVIGILASRIKERFNRPVIVFAPGIEGELKGSARSIAGLHIRDVLALMDVHHPKLINKFGGHAMAAGLTIARHVLDDFVNLFNQVVSTQLTAAQLEHTLFSDGELTLEELSVETADMLQEAGPWGQAFPEPLFDDVFIILDQRLVGDKHLKLRLQKDQLTLDAIAFFVDTALWPNHRCQQIRAAYRLDVNEFRNRRSLQLIIEYFQPLN